MKESIIKNSKLLRKAIIKGVYITIPFAVCGGVFISLSYLLDIINGAEAIYGLGNTNPFAVIFNSIGSTAFMLMLPVLSASIAESFAGKGAFIAGIVGGYLAQSGASLSLPFGDTTAVSGVLGAVFAAFLAGFITKAVKKLITRSRFSLIKEAKSIIVPLISIGFTSIMVMAFNPLVSLLNTGVSAILMVTSTANPIVFGGILGAMSAIDMGGAFSKAAFIFATAAIASGEYTAMAVVMAAGMSVPLSVALSSMVFSVKFSKKEKQLARANLLFGLCSIPDGAIPIAAKSPGRILPAFAIGAAVSGALSAGFGCTLIAPFGGILLLPVTGRPLLFLISVFTGTLVGTVTLGILKREPSKELIPGKA